jgi:hypothetical protein
MTEPLNHKLDISKIKTLTDVKNVFECMNLYSNASEDNEQYELIKEYFTIPNEAQELVGFKLPRKSLEEIQQEFDEKFDRLIDIVKNDYWMSYDWVRAKQKYEDFCNQQDSDFKYARETGFFPPKLTGTSDYSKLTAIGSSNITSSFVIKEGGKEVGYYTFGNGYLKYCMNKKPTAIVRFFMNKLLGFRWVDV